MSAVAAISAAFADDPDVIVVDADGPHDAVLDRIRTTKERFVLVMAGANVPAVSRAMILASIGPLAIELGPERRIGALNITADARQTNILEIARFLTCAESTTGQVLAVSA